MLGFQSAKRLTIAAAAATMLLALPTVADAQSTGSVQIRVASAGLVIGSASGTGTLRFKRRTYPLSVGGLSAGTIGVATADFVGTASNLRAASDIVGTYSVAGGGLTVGGGASAVTLQNSNGVVLNLRGRQAGLKATLGFGGVEIRMR